jgi:flagellar biosynthetic protein FliR
VPALLEQLLTAEAFAVFLVFARVGGAFAVLPGFAEASVPMRIRLVAAGAVAVMLAPVVAGSLPRLPESPLALAALLLGEVCIGLFLGMIARISVAALQTTGTVIGLQSGMSSAMMFDPAFGQTTIVTASFMTIVALLLIFATDMHHVMLAAVAESYGVFPAGDLPRFDDVIAAGVRLVSDSFRLGVQIAAPALVLGTVFFVGMGLLSRLMPQMQVFFIALPAQIAIVLIATAVTLGLALNLFLDGFRDHLSIVVR